MTTLQELWDELVLPDEMFEKMANGYVIRARPRPDNLDLPFETFNPNEVLKRVIPTASFKAVRDGLNPRWDVYGTWDEGEPRWEQVGYLTFT